MQLRYSSFFRSPGGWRAGLLLGLLGCLAGRSLAQAPAVTAVSPARNARSAAASGPLSLTFSQPISAATASNLRVYSGQRGGQLVRSSSGTLSGGGTTQVQFAPGQPWRPGETLSVSVPATVQSMAGGAATPHVYQFTAVAGSSGGGVFASSFGSEVTIGQTYPQSVTTADVDGDGDLDLLTTISSRDRVRIDLNAGNGTFGNSFTLNVADYPTSVTTGDVDGDGDLDLAVVVGSGSTTGGVAIFTNNGSGSFTSAGTVLVGQPVNAIALGDIDGDGDMDIATANFALQPAINFLLNSGNGTFITSLSTLVMGQGLNDVALGDVDNDGDLDLLAVSYSASQLFVRFNNGSGVFSGTGGVTCPGNPVSMVLGDLDGDGDLDAAVSNAMLNQSLSLYRNNGSGTFTQSSLPDGRPTLVDFNTAVTVRTVPSDVAMADVDGDGDLDLVALTRINTKVVFNGSEFEGRGEIRLWDNNGSGTFSPSGATSVGIGPGSMAVGDLDGDQDIDLLANGYVNDNITGNTTCMVSVRLNGARVSSLTTGPISQPSTCRSSSVNVPFTAVGDFDISNVFTAQLSDASGSFASPTNIGVLRGTVPGTIPAFIPAGTPLGSGYRIRVVSNHLPFTGTDNGTDLTVFEFNASNIVATAAPNPVAAGGTLSLGVTGSAAGLPGLTYAWTGPNSFSSSLRNPQLPGLASANAGQYRVTVTGGDCSYTSTVTVSVTAPSITTGDPLGGATQFCAGSSILVPFTTSGPFPAGTQFELFISAEDGTFTNRTLITRVSGTGSGTITANLLTTQRNGTRFRVQVSAVPYGSNPLTPSPTDLTVTNLNLAAPALGITANTPVAEGADLSLDVANVPLNGATFAWTGPNGFASTIQNPTIPTVSAAAAGSYSVTVTLNGCTRTLSRSVSVTPTPRSTTVGSLAAGTVCAGETFSLPFTTTGAFNANNVFTAQLSNAAGTFTSGITTLGTLAGTTGGTITATVPASVAAGTGYRLRVQASSTSTTGASSSFTIGVVNLTDVVADSNAPLEEGHTLSLTLASVPTGATFAWTGPNGFTAGLQNPTLPAVTLAAGGTYAVTLTLGGCSVTRTLSVPVVVAPIEVTAVSPTRNLRNATPGSPLGITLSQAVSAATANNVRVFSGQRGGQLQRPGGGTLSGGGTAQLGFAPAQPWRPGETVSVSVPGTVRSLDGVRGVRPHVYQFTTAAGGAGGGIFGGGQDFPINGSQNSGVFRINTVFADLNGDGLVDLLAAGTMSGYNSINRYFNNGAGGFSAGIETRYPYFISDLAVGDVDNDGDLDFLLTETNHDMVTVGYNDGTGTFSRTVRMPVGESPARVTLGDVDGDGDLDFITANGGPSGNVRLSLGRNDGTGSFGVSTTIAMPSPTREVALGDLDGDGDLDLVASQGNATMLAVIRLNDGTGTFGGTDQLTYSGGGGGDLRLADMDNDGHPDIVIGSRTNVFVYHNNGSGGFTATTGLTLASPISDLAVGDINGDGNLDVLATTLSFDNCEVYLNSGTATFAAGTSFYLTTSPRGRLALADIDGDQDLDFAGGTIVGNAVRVRLNGGTTLPPTITSFTPVNGTAGTQVLVSGTNLYNITAASFNGTPVALADITSNTNTSVRLVAPAGGSTGPLSVTTAGGTGSSAQSFTYLVATTLSTDALAAGSYCAGASISVPFTAAGSYLAGNVFRAQLSDAGGTFGTGTVVIGTLTGTASGTITGTIPAGTASGSLYRVRVVASNPATTATTTQPLSITAAGAVTWLGGTSTDWFTAVNWSCGQVPTAATNVTIGAGAAYYPVVTGGAAEARDLTVAAGASFTLGSTLSVRGNLTIDGSWTAGGSLVFGGGTGGSNRISGAAPVVLGQVTIGAGTTVQLGKAVAVTGDWTNNGGFDPAGYGVTLSGSTVQVLGGSQATRFYDLTVQNAAGVSCTAATGVAHLLTLTTGDLAANGLLTLHSDATGTAMVVNPAGGGRVTGRATMERFITGAGSPGYRHYASPMALGSATVQEFADDLPVFELNPAYNTQGNTVTPFPTFYQYDESRLASAITNNFSRGWMTPLATDNLLPGRGYSAQTQATTTVDISGTLTTGAVSIPLTRGGQSGSGWNLVGNPYPAPIDWDLVPATAGLDKALYVFVPSGPYTGTYGSYVNGVGQNGGGKDMAAMQGFFVRATAPATLRLTDAVRHTSYLSPGFGRSATSAAARPLLRLHVRNAAGQADETVVYAEPGAGAGFQAGYDAYKVQFNGNGLPSIWSQAGSDALSINGLPDLGTAGSLPLGVRVSQTGVHRLVASALLNLPAGTQVVLEDRELNRRQNLAVDSTYAFHMDASYTGPRFYLWFQSQVLTTRTDALEVATSLYPNPTTGITTLTMSGLREQGALQVEVLNALGQRVLALLARPRRGVLSQVLDVSLLPTGVYSVRVQAAEGTVVKRLVRE